MTSRLKIDIDDVMKYEMLTVYFIMSENPEAFNTVVVLRKPRDRSRRCFPDFGGGTVKWAAI